MFFAFLRERFVKCFLYIALFFSAFLLNANAFAESPVRFDSLIESVSHKYGVDPMLVKALIWRESRFSPRAKGASGEIGLMQIKMVVVEDWAAFHKVGLPDQEEVYDPYLNIEIGVWYLAKAVRNWEGNPDCYRLALCEYNAGRRTLLRWIAHHDGSYTSVLEYSASSNYVKAIADKYVEYTLEYVDPTMVAFAETLNRDLNI